MIRNPFPGRDSNPPPQPGRQTLGVWPPSAAPETLRNRAVRRLGCALLLGLFLGGIPTAWAQFAITEFMAANTTVLNDEDGENSDWIELRNEGPTMASLAGWFLTDATNNLMKWQLPATNLPPSGHLVVFASEKDRRNPGAPLHTNFKLSSGGEYLALVAPDGRRVVSDFSPIFPPQVADVSYGRVRNLALVPLVAPGAPARVVVPPDSRLGLTWTQVDFDDAGWTSGTTGIGYDRQTIGVDFLPLIGLNVESSLYSKSGSLYARVPFVVTNASEILGLTLRMRFEDGFIAYLNGREIARSNAPAQAVFNSTATTPRTDTAATNVVEFDVSDARELLNVGTNVLSFQALNSPISSPDLLLLPELMGITANGEPLPRYFPVATPGRDNNTGVATLGPLISEVHHSPAEPNGGEAIHVTARIRPAFAPVASALLHYRVMFGSEVNVALRDDGASGDGAAGDGIYGGTIPAGVGGSGQMVRWFVSSQDSTGTNNSRLPAFTAPKDSPAYFGTVFRDPTLTNRLPVFHWFVSDVGAADTTAGTRASVFWNGEFYDNVFCRVRGASAPNFAKKPYKFDFNPGDHFRFQPGAPRTDELNLNTTYQDKAYLRAPLAFETYRLAGVPASDAFNVRVQRNGSFYSVATFAEQVDGTFLERRGLDPNGALYKMYNGITSSSSDLEKKTRRQENNADLQALVSALALSNRNRGTNLFDFIDLPAVINYLAAGILSQDLDRMIKNLYLYRDTQGSGQWRMLPWDKDLTFGLFGLECDRVSGNDDSAPYQNCGGGYISHPLVGTSLRNFGHVNNLVDAIYATPATLEMFLRRLRTLMDEFLQSPETPPELLRYERRIAELAAYLQPDASLDLGKWRGGFGQQQTLTVALDAIRNNYFAQRRVHLYQTHSIDNVAAYRGAAGVPNAQPPNPVLAFGAIEFRTPSGDSAQEFVELLNPNPFAVDLSGWTVEGAIRFRFAPGTVVPALRPIYLTADIAAFRSRTFGPRGGQGLLVVGNYSGQLSARGESLTLRNPSGLSFATTNYPGAPSEVQQSLRITEIMYHPPSLVSDPYPGEEYEFLELQNVSTNKTLNLAGVRLTDGISFVFPEGAGSVLAPGSAALVVKNLAAFTHRYGGGLPVVGQYQGSLENQGERLVLLDAAGEEVLDFSYRDEWYRATDGLGFSLVAVDELAAPQSWNHATQWRPGGVNLGSPGRPEPQPTRLPQVVINEVLSRDDLVPGSDRVELFNPTAERADVGGWFLTDDLREPKKFRLPVGTVLEPGGFAVFGAADFNPGGAGFSLSSSGDELWLFSADPQANLTGYVHGFRFGAADQGISFGRMVDSAGREQFVPQLESTFGRTNSGPRVGPLVISEVQYHPPAFTRPDASRRTVWDVLRGDPQGAEEAAAELEFIEVHNITATAVPLFLPSDPSRTWRLRGDVTFDFPRGLIVAPGAVLLLVNFDPVIRPDSVAAFRAAYGLPADALILGPCSTQLADSGARLELAKPVLLPDGGVGTVVADAVEYGDSAPWPEAADGHGLSLQRRWPALLGDDPGQWVAVRPSPGRPVVVEGIPPLITEFPSNQFRLLGQRCLFRVGATGSAPLRYQWRRNGVELAGETRAELELPQVSASDAGVYQVMVHNDAGSVLSSPRTLELQYPPVILAQPQGLSVRPGSNGGLSVVAFGTAPLRYQWRKEGTPLAGATHSNLNFTNLQPSDNGTYTVEVADAIGSVVSAPAPVTLLINPIIIQHPVSQSMVPGGTLVVSVTVTNHATLPIGYRLRRNNVALPINPANYMVLNERTVYFTLSGTNTMPPWTSYSIQVTNAALPGGNTSANANLTYLLDSDRDGLPDDWEQTFFGSTTAAEAGLDADGDGMTAAQEYVAGTDPKDPLSFLRVHLGAGSNVAMIEFPAVANRSYTILVADSPVNPVWRTLARFAPSAIDHRETMADPAWTTNRFYRLRVE